MPCRRMPPVWQVCLPASHSSQYIVVVYHSKPAYAYVLSSSSHGVGHGRGVRLIVLSALAAALPLDAAADEACPDEPPPALPGARIAAFAPASRFGAAEAAVGLGVLPAGDRALLLWCDLVGCSVSHHVDIARC